MGIQSVSNNTIEQIITTHGEPHEPTAAQSERPEHSNLVDIFANRDQRMAPLTVLHKF